MIILVINKHTKAILSPQHDDDDHTPSTSQTDLSKLIRPLTHSIKSVTQNNDIPIFALVRGLDESPETCNTVVLPRIFKLLLLVQSKGAGA